jgi:hypothetical protein
MQPFDLSTIRPGSAVIMTGPIEPKMKLLEELVGRMDWCHESMVYTNPLDAAFYQELLGNPTILSPPYDDAPWRRELALRREQPAPALLVVLACRMANSVFNGRTMRWLFSNGPCLGITLLVVAGESVFAHPVCIGNTDLCFSFPRHGEGRGLWPTETFPEIELSQALVFRAKEGTIELYSPEVDEAMDALEAPETTELTDQSQEPEHLEESVLELVDPPDHGCCATQ